jgi:hypothetical protein
MPTYGDDKVKDIIESLLPSSARKNARIDRKAAHRKERRKVRRFPLEYTPDRVRRHEINEMMWTRRANDKVSSFMRWAVKASEHLDDPEDRFNYIKSLVPDNTIGRHALSHIDYLDEFDFREYNYGRRNYTKAEREEHADAREREREERYLVAVQKLYDVIASGDHKKLNAAIKRAHNRLGHVRKRRVGMYKFEETGYEKCDKCLQPRLLGGIHDVEAFIFDIARVNGGHTEW